jgi:hypothetical protein
MDDGMAGSQVRSWGVVIFLAFAEKKTIVAA